MRGQGYFHFAKGHRARNSPRHSQWCPVLLLWCLLQGSKYKLTSSQWKCPYQRKIAMPLQERSSRPEGTPIGKSLSLLESFEMGTKAKTWYNRGHGLRGLPPSNSRPEIEICLFIQQCHVLTLEGKRKQRKSLSDSFQKIESPTLY